MLLTNVTPAPGDLRMPTSLGLSSVYWLLPLSRLELDSLATLSVMLVSIVSSTCGRDSGPGRGPGHAPLFVRVFVA